MSCEEPEINLAIYILTFIYSVLIRVHSRYSWADAFPLLTTPTT